MLPDHTVFHVPNLDQILITDSVKNFVTIICSDPDGNCRHPDLIRHKLQISVENVLHCVAGFFGRVDRDDLLSFHTGLLDFLTIRLSSHLGILTKFTDDTKSRSKDPSCQYLLTVIKALGDFIVDEAPHVPKFQNPRFRKDLKGIIKKQDVSLISKMIAFLAKLSQEVNTGVHYLYDRLEKRLSEYNGSWADLILHSIEAASFGNQSIAEIADQLEAQSLNLRSLASQVHSILAFRCEIQMTNHILNNYLLPRLSRGFEELHPKIKSLLAAAPELIQPCFNAIIIPASQKIIDEQKRLFADLFSFVVTSPYFVAVTPIKRYPDTVISQVVRLATLIGYSLLVNTLVPESLIGFFIVFRKYCVEFASRFQKVDDEKGRWVTHRRFLYQSGLAVFDRALIDLQAPPQELAFMCLDLGFVVGSFGAEQMAAGSLLKLLNLLFQIGTPKPQPPKSPKSVLPARVFLLYKSCIQLALFQYGTLAIQIFLDVIERLRYSIDLPPDVSKMRKLCQALSEYVEVANSLMAIDSSILIGGKLKQTVGVLRRFFVKEVKLECEFFEKKLKQAIETFNQYASLLRYADGQVSEIEWNCDIPDFVGYIQLAEGLITSLIQNSGAVEVQNEMAVLARTLLEIETLLDHFDVLPRPPEQDLTNIAFSLLTIQQPERIPELLNALSEYLVDLKQQAPGFVVRSGNAPTVVKSPEAKRLLLEKLQTLKTMLRNHNLTSSRSTGLMVLTASITKIKV
jgi:hypothetical protein